MKRNFFFIKVIKFKMFWYLNLLVKIKNSTFARKIGINNIIRYDLLLSDPTEIGDRH